MSHSSYRPTIAASTANLGITGAKFLGFLLARAASMLAQAGHSFADMADQGLLLHGSIRASRKATTSTTEEKSKTVLLEKPNVINCAEQRLRALVPAAHTIYLEPDFYRAQPREVDASELAESV